MSEQYKNGLWNLLLEGSPDNPMTAMDMMLARHRQRIEKAAMQNAEPNSSIRNVPDNTFQSWLNESGQRLMNPTDTIAQGVKDFTGQSDVDMGLGLMGGGVGATVWHGSPHTFGKFDASKIGTGEGAQAYGHGHYTGGARKVGETYKRAGSGLEVNYAKPLQELGINPNVASHSMAYDESPLNQALGRITKGLRTTALDYPDVPLDQKLVKAHFDEEIRMLNDKYPKEAAQKKALQDLVAKEGYPDINFGGNLYKVDLPDEHIAKMLDWDKPLSQQHPDVQQAILSVNPLRKDSYGYIWHGNNMVSTNGSIEDEWKNIVERGGKNALKTLASSNKGMAHASSVLKDAGIPGVRYLDGGSRGVGEGSSNYVVFPGNEDMLTILERNGQKIK